MRGGYHPYVAPARTSEDDRCLLNWLSSRVDEHGNVHPDHEHERRLIEPRLKLARSLGLNVQADVYLPRPETAKGAATRGKKRPHKAA